MGADGVNCLSYRAGFQLLVQLESLARGPCRSIRQRSKPGAVGQRTKFFVFSKDSELLGVFNELKDRGDEVVSGADSRFLVLELFKAINSALPRPSEDIDPMSVSKQDYSKRTELYIDTIDSQYFENVSDYFAVNVNDHYTRGFLKDLAMAEQSAKKASETVVPGDEVDDEESSGEEETEVTIVEPEQPDMNRPGWVVQVKGFHFQNTNFLNANRQYLINSFMRQLEKGTVDLPSGPGGPLTTFTMKELGIYYPVVSFEDLDVPIQVPDLDPNAVVETTSKSLGGEFGRANKPTVPMKSVEAYEFAVQFIWLETPASKRMEARKQKQAADTADDVVGN